MCTYGAGAQGTNDVTDFTQSKSFQKTFQFQVQTIDSILNGNMAELTHVNARAVNDFKSRFDKVLNEKWYAIPDGFESYFNMDGCGDRALYDKKGRWQGTIKTYKEDQLPTEVRKLVKGVYFDYSISMVEEVDIPGNFVYLIHLEDKTSFKIIRVNQDFELDVMQEFQKG